MGACYCIKNTHRKSIKKEDLNGICKVNGYSDIDLLTDGLPEIIKSLYISYQKSYKKNFEEFSAAFSNSENKKTQEIKRFVRRGISDSDMYDLLETAFNLQETSYKPLISAVFPKNRLDDLELIPTYSQHTLLEKAVLKLYINDAGKSELKILMWVLTNIHVSISFCPQLVNIASLLLVYLKEEETYNVLKSLITASSHQQNFIEKHLTVSKAELCKLVGIVLKVLEKKAEELLDHLNKNKVSLKDTVADIIMRFGIGYFSLPLLTRLLPIFLIEGNKAFVKVVISMFILYTDDLISGDVTDFEQLVKSHFSSQVIVELIISKAFKVKLTRFNFEGSESELNLKNPIYLYAPYVEKPFSLMEYKYLQLLWGALPNLYRTYKPVLVYNSEAHGLSLRTLLSKSQDFEDKSPMIFALKSESHSIFGVFLDCSIRKSKKLGTIESFLFQVEPEYRVFNSTNQDMNFANVTSDALSFGAGGHGPALLVDKYLSICQSFTSLTFDNPVFDSGYFNVIVCEVIALVAN